MTRAVLVLALSCGVTSCVTGAGIARKDRVTLPILIGATAADLVVSSLVFAQFDSISTAGAIASGVAFTAVDVGIGCVIGACAVLKP